MTERHASRLGELVGGKYRLIRFIAEGGMGIVYEAQHEVVRRRFAVKLLRADLTARREILTRFQREAEAAGALESENVTAAVDFGICDDGTPYIVMEYLVGEGLASLLEREKTLPVARAADLCQQACRGIGAAHGAGIVHQDLQPQNLFVCRREDGTDLLKVLDFGVAKLQAIDENSAATRTGTVLGTVAYMSPEQARGDKEVDHKADVYALGAILYELLSGKKPHPGESYNAILYHISTQPSVPLASVRPDLPPTLVEVVERAIASDPAERYETAGAFGAALAPFGRREVWPEPAERPAPSQPGRVIGQISSSSRRASASAEKPPSRSPPADTPGRLVGAVLVTAVIVILASIAIVAGVMRSVPEKREAAADWPATPTRAAADPPPRAPPPPAAPAAAAAPSPAAAPPASPAAVSPVRPARTPAPGRARARAVEPGRAEPAPRSPAEAEKPLPGRVTFDPQNPYD